MKTTILKENLAYGLSIAARATSPRSTLPILQNVLLAAEPGSLHLSATNLELSLTCQVQAQVERTGKCTVPAATLTELAKTLPEGPVSLEWAEATQTLHVRGAGDATKTQLKGITANEFPPIETPSHTPTLRVQARTLKDLIRQVTIAASRDEARPSLTGVLFTAEPEALPQSGYQLRLAAADGFRLAVVSSQIPYTETANHSPTAFEALVPVRALVELARVLPNKGEVALTLDTGRILFQTEGLQLASQLIDAQFPDYAQVIPKSHQTRTVFNRDAFLNACKQAGIFARESAQIARLSLQPGCLRISAQAEETGSNESSLSADVQGPELEIVFNVRFLQDIAEVMPAPNMVLETTTASAPGVFRISDESGCLHVLMPMNA